MTVLPGSGGQGPLTAAQRLRQGANLVNGTTLLGLAVAVAARTDLAKGPRGLLIAGGYRWRLPFAGAFALGNVVLCRSTAGELLARRELLRHEERHCSQYAWCLGVPFLPLYLLAAGWSVLRTGNPGTANVFERHAGLAAGGYPAKGSLRHGSAPHEVRDPRLWGRRRRRTP
ncbi:hypothetical protein [Pseudarthrobacter sp. NamE5]|uniref:hypothetical protein n=1 Tax=Pseudarthrobacter sp. NamE5 TaxID=2576839 RepID=UPI001F0F80CB|nr:hypothetical protein [Pseudarthrobacter sp. NamE5]